jgi:hypothetical protein
VTGNFKSRVEVLRILEFLFTEVWIRFHVSHLLPIRRTVGWDSAGFQAGEVREEKVYWILAF